MEKSVFDRIKNRISELGRKIKSLSSETLIRGSSLDFGEIQRVADNVRRLYMVMSGERMNDIQRPSNVESALKIISESANNVRLLQEHYKQSIVPLVSQVQMLSTGNRNDAALIKQVRKDNTDPASGQAVLSYEDLLKEMRKNGLTEETEKKVDVLDDPGELLSSLNVDRAKWHEQKCLNAIQSIAPASQLAPNGYVHASSNAVWNLDLSQEGISATVDTSEDGITTDVDSSTPAFTATNYLTAISFTDESTSGYKVMPPKSGTTNKVWKWTLNCNFSCLLTNDGTNGAILGAGLAKVRVRVWTANSLGGTLIDTQNFDLNIANVAYTGTGGETQQVNVQCQVELLPSTTEGTSQTLHFDAAIYSSDGSGTNGSAGFAASAISLNDVVITGQTTGVQCPYSLVTYTDSEGIKKTIAKDAKVEDFFGSIVHDPWDDPVYNVYSIIQARIGSGGMALGEIIEVMKEWSTDTHPSGDTLDDAYVSKGVSGITALADLINLFDYNNSDWGKSVSTSVQDKKKIAQMLGMLYNHVKTFYKNLPYDESIIDVWSNNLAFSNYNLMK